MKGFRAARIFTILIPTILVSTVLLPVPLLKSPQNTVLASYNPFPANRFHAPISSMGMISALNATPNLLGLGNVVTTAGSSPAPPRLGGAASIRQNAARFLIDDSYFPQTETSIAVDPDNPNHVVGGFNDLKFFFCPVLPSDCGSSFPVSASGFSVSTDGGKTVAKTGDLPDIQVGNAFLYSLGDPSVAAGVDGGFFYSSLAASVLNQNGIMIAKSNSNLFNPSVSCITPTSELPTSNPCWNAVFIFGQLFPFTSNLEDKSLLVVDRDPASPFYGAVYIGWDHFLYAGISQSSLARCDNNLNSCVMLSGGGRPPVSGDDLFAAFTTPLVDKNGNVYVTWCNYGTFSTYGPVVCKIRSSPPGGTGFGPTTTIMSYMGEGTTLPNATVTIGWATEQFRTFSVPSIAVDLSPNSNNLYFTTQVCVSGHYDVLSNGFFARDNPGNCGASSVLLSKSTDGGTTWTTPSTVSQMAVNDQPYVTVDTATGNVYVLYYTTQYDQFNHRIDVVASKLMNALGRFIQFRVTSVSNEPDSDPNFYVYFSQFGGAFTVPQYGDYFQAIAMKNTLWVLFTANYAVEAGTHQTDPFLAIVNA